MYDRYCTKGTYQIWPTGTRTVYTAVCMHAGTGCIRPLGDPMWDHVSGRQVPEVGNPVHLCVTACGIPSKKLISSISGPAGIFLAQQSAVTGRLFDPSPAAAAIQSSNVLKFIINKTIL